MGMGCVSSRDPLSRIPEVVMSAFMKLQGLYCWKKSPKTRSTREMKPSSVKVVIKVVVSTFALDHYATLMKPKRLTLINTYCEMGK